MAGEPGDLVLTIFGHLIDRVKSTRPVRSDGKSLTTGFVYSQLVLGMPVDPRDYADPWSPMGGATLQDTVGATPAAAGGSTTPASGSTSKPAPDPKFRKAIEAAFKTSQLVDKMIMVTDDDSFLEYPTTRHVSFAYEGIINGMQPTAMPPISPDIQKQIDDAQKVLYELDDQGDPVGKSKLYKNYKQNADAYAQAKKDYADAQAAALADPVKAETWPQDSAVFQQKVNDAWDTFKTEGAEKVERALDIIESVGVSLQDRMVAKARKTYDAWNLGLAGVPVTIPYSYISPTSWYDPHADDTGWMHLHVEQHEYQSYAASHVHDYTEDHNHFSSQSGGGAVGVFAGFFNVAGGVSGGSSEASSSGGWQHQAQNGFHNTATNLTIDFEYALCSVENPWLFGDLFYMQNWYLVNNPKDAISDGTIQGQVKNEKPLLPMLPVQFLAIRNLTISSSNWGSDGDNISSIVDSSSSQSSSSNVSGTVGVSIGFVNFGGSYSRSNADSNAQSDAQNDTSSTFTTYWDGQSLSISGTQIVAWLSEVVPACAPLDDPNLKK